MKINLHLFILLLVFGLGISKQVEGQSYTISLSTPLVVNGSASITLDGVGNQDIGVLTYATSSGSGTGMIGDPAVGFILGFNAGTISITVSSSGNSNYAPMTVEQEFVVSKGSLTLTFNSPNAFAVGQSMTAAVSKTDAFNRGGAISFTITAGSGSATVDENTGVITAISAGTVTLTAYAPGDADLFPASVSQAISIVEMITPTLTITSVNSVTVGGTLTPTVVTTAPSGQGGVITFSLTAGSGSATIDSNTGIITGVSFGTVTLVASSSGDSFYYPASTSQVINVSILSLSSSLTALEGGTGYFVLSLAGGNTFGQDVDFDITLNGGNQATAGHYQISPTVTFPAGQSSLTITVNALSDSILFNDELLAVDISNSTLGTFTGAISLVDATAANPANLVITIGEAFIYRNQTVSVPVSLPAGITSIRPIDIALSWSAEGQLFLSPTLPNGGANPSVPTSVTILANSSSASFNVTAASTASELSVIRINGSVVGNVSATYTVRPGRVIITGEGVMVLQTFSPNGDGIGDQYPLPGITDYPDNTVRIFNMSGEFVYEASGYNNSSVAFNGNSLSGSPLPDATYFTYVEYFNNGRPYRRVQFFQLKR